MPRLDEHFDALTRVRPPLPWPELDDVPTGALPPRRERSRRIGVALLALGIAVAGIAVAVMAFERSEPGTSPATHPPSPTAAAPSPTIAGPAPTAGPTTPPASPPGMSGSPAASPVGTFGAMIAGITESIPRTWDMHVTFDRLDGDWYIDGDVDDGSGPGRLLVNLTTRPNMLTAHPCDDSEFVQGGRCVERLLDDGSLLVLRDIVVDAGGMKTIEAVLIHPDRSGLGAEAGNWTIATLPDGSPANPDELPMPRVTRPEPLFTVEQLGRLLQAVDERTAAQGGSG